MITLTIAVTDTHELERTLDTLRAEGRPSAPPPLHKIPASGDIGCPFCGSQKIHPTESHVMLENDDKRVEHYVRCKNCGAHGPHAPTLVVALETWRIRKAI